MTACDALVYLLALTVSAFACLWRGIAMFVTMYDTYDISKYLLAASFRT